MRSCKRIGGIYLGESRCRFRVWAPFASRVELVLVSPRQRVLEMEPRALGYYQAVVEETGPGTRYLYRLDGKLERPDPASEYQPEGVHGPSEVVDHTFSWGDEHWRGLDLHELILYELHVGVFSHKGTFDGVVKHLDELTQLGVNAIEIMPVAQFPGGRNWGYDGVYPFAVQNSYGGPQGLKKLVDACHRRGLAVILDVVYNHLGPEGNYLGDFAPYFTDRYRTPWGSAINFDGAGSDEVRRFFLEHALFFVTQFHLDGLRLDAIHGIMDFSARPFLQELTRRVHRRGRQLGRKVHVIAESDLNDVRAVTARHCGGLGFDAQWNDDFHHALHSLLTGEREGYYRDFGKLRHLARSFREGFVYSGQYSRYRARRHGSSSRDISPWRMVVFTQNHDQVGNRASGERLSALVDPESLKLAAAVVILSPFLPLLFMGEEYGETAPFLYFISHLDKDLVEAVRLGRKEEFSAFQWREPPADPHEEDTFFRSKLKRELKSHRQHRALFRFYQELIRLRKEILRSGVQAFWGVKEMASERLLSVESSSCAGRFVRLYYFGKERFQGLLPLTRGVWRKRIDSWEAHWEGPGSLMGSVLECSGELWAEFPCRGALVLELVDCRK